MAASYGVKTVISKTLLLAQTTAPTGEEPQADVLSSAYDWLKTHFSLEWVLQKLTTYGPNLLGAVIVFVVGRWLARVVTAAVIRGARRARVDETLVSFLNNLIYMVLLTAVCISSLSRLGVNLNALTAVLAAAGFAVGMAMQGSLGNLAAGVMLVFFKPFRVGDVVEICGSRGTIVEIQLFNTILLTLDNVRIVVPNGKITDGTIQNFSAERERRIDLVVGCGYNDDIRLVKEALQRIVDEHPQVLSTPGPVVAVAELADSSVNFVVRPWVLSEDYWDVRFALTEQIKLTFDERGFTIPFPSRDLFLHNPAVETASLPISTETQRAA